MATKHSHRGRNADVVVSLDERVVVDLLSRGVGGSLVSEYQSACRKGFTPFEWECDPKAYSCPDTFRRDWQLANCMTKFDDKKSSSVKKEAALSKFRLAEDCCKIANSRLRGNQDVRFNHFMSARDYIYVARRKIERLLGEFTWSEAEQSFDFGPGASTRLSRREGTLLRKFSGKPETTSNCADLSRTAMRYYSLWREAALIEADSAEDGFTIVAGNCIDTVPKNYKEDRVIGVEPCMNMFFQKGIGAMIRRRLKRVQINLNDQTRNQDLAKLGSETGLLATLDLKMASDTVNRAIVEMLIPPDWLLALEQCRSPVGVLPSGEIIRYQKFSSMGNGNTFELESLIFWALCSAVCENLCGKDACVGVYGDDLIVNTSAVETVVGLLNFCGFSLNLKKSFYDGPFRESCGKHYFNGTDVTPFYVRQPLRRLTDVFLLHNNVVRWCGKGGLGRDSGVDGALRSLCDYLRSVVPSNWRTPRIPDGYGDGAFIGSFDETLPKLRPRYSKDRGFEAQWRVSVILESAVDTAAKRQLGSSFPDYSEGPRGAAALCAVLSRTWSGRAPSIAARLPLLEAGEPARVVQCDRSPISGGNSVVGQHAGVHPKGGLGGFGTYTVAIDPRVGRYESRVSMVRVGKILVTQWADLGPWF